MSRRHQRAVALLLLHQQMMGGLPAVPPAIFSEACAVPAPLPWYRRAWAWLRDRYLLTGWQASA